MLHSTLFKFSLIVVQIAEDSCDEIVGNRLLILNSEFLVDFNELSRVFLLLISQHFLPNLSPDNHFASAAFYL